MPSPKIQRLTAGDFAELIAFLDKAFDHTDDRSFAAFLAPVYQPTDEDCGCNYSIKVGGKIAAIVGLFPIKPVVAGIPLRVAGIGGVSVGREHRGRGYMKQLMNHVRGEAVRQGYHFSYLGGLRQRYAYFGWEKAGQTVRFSLGKTNFRYVFGDTVPGAAAVRPVAANDPLLPAIEALHDQQVIHCRRRRFAMHLWAWDGQPYAAVDRHGRVRGYAVANKQGISEIVAQHAATVHALCAGVIAQRNIDWVNVMVGPTDAVVLASLGAIAESVSVHESGNWQIFDWPTTIGGLLAARRMMGPLPAGSLVLGVEDAHTRIRLTLDGSGARCEKTRAATDISGDSKSIIRMLSGPVQPRPGFADSPAGALLSAWCPLPLYLSVQDHV